MLRLVSEDRYNSLSSALTLLALANLPQGTLPPDGLTMAQSSRAGKDDSFSTFGAVRGALLQGRLDPASRALRLSRSKGGDPQRPAWYSLSQTGYLREMPTKAVQDGIEILREYRDSRGKRMHSLELGQEMTVHTRLRSLKDPVDDVAIVASSQAASRW